MGGGLLNKVGGQSILEWKDEAGVMFEMGWLRRGWYGYYG
jgi:hypothetical protein